MLAERTVLEYRLLRSGIAYQSLMAMHPSIVYDLVTAEVLAKRQDALLLAEAISLGLRGGV